VAEPLVVFDCVTFVQSIIKKSDPAVRCLEMFEEGRFSLAISKETLAEIQQVLSLSNLRNDFPLLTEEKTTWLIEFLLYKGKLYQNIKRRFEYPRDPDDEPYLNLAIKAKADFIVTRDKDLLDLMKWDTEEGHEFQKRFRHVNILDPVAFLREMALEEAP